MMDEIRIDNLEVYCHHGVLKEETVLGQKFLVSLVLYTDTRKAGKSDDLSRSIDYAEVSHFVEQQMKAKNYKLIEAAAEHLAEELLLHFPKVKQIQVNLKKPWAPILLPLENVGVTIRRGWTRVCLSVGSNMGNRRGQIAAAVQALKAKDRIRHLEVSDLIETEPYGYKEQENFLNGAIVFDTLYSPEELLVCLQQIEEAGHRERTVHWGPRTIDLDIIFYGDRVVDKEKLKIPHREMHLRKFVLEPLAQIAPWEVHPLFHKSVYEMLQDLESGDSTEKEGKSL